MGTQTGIVFPFKRKPPTPIAVLPLEDHYQLVLIYQHSTTFSAGPKGYSKKQNNNWWVVIAADNKSVTIDFRSGFKTFEKLGKVLQIALVNNRLATWLHCCFPFFLFQSSNTNIPIAHFLLLGIVFLLKSMKIEQPDCHFGCFNCFFLVSYFIHSNSQQKAWCKLFCFFELS